MCSISRDPRCQEYTICTAVAPDAVFTVRTYGTRQLHGPGLVCKSSSAELRTSRSQRSRQPRTRIVSQLRAEPAGGQLAFQLGGELEPAISSLPHQRE